MINVGTPNIALSTRRRPRSPFRRFIRNRFSSSKKCSSIRENDIPSSIEKKTNESPSSTITSSSSSAVPENRIESISRVLFTTRTTFPQMTRGGRNNNNNRRRRISLLNFRPVFGRQGNGIGRGIGQSLGEGVGRGIMESNKIELIILLTAWFVILFLFYFSDNQWKNLPMAMIMIKIVQLLGVVENSAGRRSDNEY